ncbi:MAG: thiamine pyrophosphate-binding protein [Clostridium sp.]
MKVSDYIVKFIESKGINTIFGYQGGAITHLIDSIYKNKKMKFVSMYHEQGAAFAAEGYSRQTLKTGVAVATSGPGATNLITGIGSCYFDSISCLFITGQVNLSEYKNNKDVRQIGFQETDIVSLVKPITKFAITIKSSKKIRYYLEKAFFLSNDGRRGPVLLDIPMNIQNEDIDVDTLKGYKIPSKRVKNLFPLTDKVLLDVLAKIQDSKRPLILCGGGIRGGNSIAEVEKFLKKTNIPAVVTLMGLDSMSHHNESFVGFIGAYGNRYGNLALANCDLLIVLGARLTSRQTGPNYKTFAREAKIIHIDIDERELNLKLPATIAINSSISDFLNGITPLINELNFDFSDWHSKINEYKNNYPSYPTQKNFLGIDPNETMYLLSNFAPNNTSFILDVGQNQIWAAQSLDTKENQRIIVSGGMAAMGFALPAAIGAYYGDPSREFVVIVGDGGFQMNIQELQVIVRDKIPIKIILMNNHTLGMIRHFQELYFQGRYFGTLDGYTSPDFINICKAYDLHSSRVIFSSELSFLKDIFTTKVPEFLEINLSTKTYVIPKLEMGHPIEDQSPLINRDELKKNMFIDTLR